MKFLDANIFIYAFYKPKGQLTAKEKLMKQTSKEIVSRISSGEEDAITSVVHISEVVNILKQGMPADQLHQVVHGLFMLDNLNITGVTKNSYFAAVELGEDLNLEANDALAVDIMKANEIKEIYTFDEHFDKIDGITKLPKLT